MDLISKILLLEIFCDGQRSFWKNGQLWARLFVDGQDFFIAKLSRCARFLTEFPLPIIGYNLKNVINLIRDHSTPMLSRCNIHQTSFNLNTIIYPRIVKDTVFLP